MRIFCRVKLSGRLILFSRQGTPVVHAKTELICSDNRICAVRRCLPEPFASETKLSVRFVRKSCLSVHAARVSRASPSKRGIDGPEESSCVFVSFMRCCLRSSCCARRQRRLRKLAWSLGSARPRYLFMSSLFVQATVFSGHLATGPTITTSTITTGCRAHG